MVLMSTFDMWDCEDTLEELREESGVSEYRIVKE